MPWGWSTSQVGESVVHAGVKSLAQATTWTPWTWKSAGPGGTSQAWPIAAKLVDSRRRMDWCPEALASGLAYSLALGAYCAVQPRSMFQLDPVTAPAEFDAR